jgi:threonine dehydratase
MRRALDEQRPVVIDKIDTIADGLAPVMAGELTYEHASSLMDDVVTVTDDAIREATTLLVSKQKLIVEFSGAAATAALLSKAVEATDARVAVVISGGNLDPTLLAGVA